MTLKERPILMSGPMVRAILEGRKTQTRRIAKDITEWNIGENPMESIRVEEGVAIATCQIDVDDTMDFDFPCRYGKVGDGLWVRETFGVTDERQVVFRAEGEDEKYRIHDHKWKPSIFMPRTASRITLEITDVRVERLNEISEEDADAEGFGGDIPHIAFPEFDWTREVMAGGKSIPECFTELWEHINGKGSFAANPFVWVVSFKRINPKVLVGCQ